MWYNDIVGWSVDKLTYTYTVGTLRQIADYYCSLYNQEFFHPQADLFSIALYKADFDMSLNAIGKGYWSGLDNTDFRAYRYFGKAQQIVIADIIGITDYELKGLGFYQVPQLRGKAYRWMADFLNEFHTDGESL